eukprot:1161125-Pelagomonas_calceolata.AAC.17
MDCPFKVANCAPMLADFIYIEWTRILELKRTTPNWSVLRECGHEPLQLYLFCAAVGFYNAFLHSNSTTLSKNIWLHAQAWTGATCVLIVFGQGSL